MPQLSKSQIINPNPNINANNTLDVNLNVNVNVNTNCIINKSAIYTNLPLTSEASILKIVYHSDLEAEPEPEPSMTNRQSDNKGEIIPINTHTDLKTDLNANKPRTCRFCHEEETDQSKLVNPCQCIGSCKYIHIHCLKTWITNSFVLPIEKEEDYFRHFSKPKCELCEWEYLFKFYFSLSLPQRERCQVIKSSFNYFCLYLLFVFSCGAVLYLIVTSIADMTTQSKIYLIIGLVCLAVIGLVALMVREVKVIRLKKMKMVLNDWSFFNYEEYDDVLAADDKAGDKEKEKDNGNGEGEGSSDKDKAKERRKNIAKEKERLKWVTYLEDNKWYTNLIYRRRQVVILNE